MDSDSCDLNIYFGFTMKQNVVANVSLLLIILSIGNQLE